MNVVLADHPLRAFCAVLRRALTQRFGDHDLWPAALSLHDLGANMAELSLAMDDVIEAIDAAVADMAPPAKGRDSGHRSGSTTQLDRSAGVRGGLVAMANDDPHFSFKLQFALWMTAAMEFMAYSTAHVSTDIGENCH